MKLIQKNTYFLLDNIKQFLVMHIIMFDKNICGKRANN